MYIDDAFSKYIDNVIALVKYRPLNLRSKTKRLESNTSASHLYLILSFSLKLLFVSNVTFSVSQTFRY